MESGLRGTQSQWYKIILFLTLQCFIPEPYTEKCPTHSIILFSFTIYSSVARWDWVSHQYENVLAKLHATNSQFLLCVYLYSWLSPEKAQFYSHCFLGLQKSILWPVSWLWDVTSESNWKTSDSPQESKTTFLNPGQECEWWGNFPKFSPGRILTKWDIDALTKRWNERNYSILRDIEKWTHQPQKMINPSWIKSCDL